MTSRADDLRKKIEEEEKTLATMQVELPKAFVERGKWDQNAAVKAYVLTPIAEQMKKIKKLQAELAKTR